MQKLILFSSLIVSWLSSFFFYFFSFSHIFCLFGNFLKGFREKEFYGKLYQQEIFMFEINHCASHYVAHEWWFWHITIAVPLCGLCKLISSSMKLASTSHTLSYHKIQTETYCASAEQCCSLIYWLIDFLTAEEAFLFLLFLNVCGQCCAWNERSLY